MTIVLAVTTVFAALSPSVFAAVFVLAMMAAIIAGGVWIFRRDQEQSSRR